MGAQLRGGRRTLPRLTVVPRAAAPSTGGGRGRVRLRSSSCCRRGCVRRPPGAADRDRAWPRPPRRRPGSAHPTRRAARRVQGLRDRHRADRAGGAQLLGQVERLTVGGEEQLRLALARVRRHGTDSLGRCVTGLPQTRASEVARASGEVPQSGSAPTYAARCLPVSVVLGRDEVGRRALEDDRAAVVAGARARGR